MALLHFDNVGIAALACAVPSFVQKINTDPGFAHASYVKSFVKKMGVTQRHISITEQTCTDLGYAALMRALTKAQWETDSLDALIFMSQTPDFNPGTGNAFVLLNHLGLSTRVLAFDITLGCSSFPYGLSVCASLLQQKAINRIAMICGDTQWSFTAEKESLLQENIFIFGEGTAALLLEKSTDNPIDIALYSDGSGYKYLYNPCSGSRNNWRHGSTMRLRDGAQIPVLPAKAGAFMDGIEITVFSTQTVVSSITNFLAGIGRPITSYDGLVLHQANKQIVNTIAKKLGADTIDVPLSLDRYGNTSGASVLLTMADAYAGRRDKALDLLVAAYGVGLSWGLVSMRLDPAVVEPIFTSDCRFEEGFIDPD